MATKKKSTTKAHALGGGTTLADAQANSAETAKQQCVIINRNLESRYKLNWDAWAVEVNAGKRDNKNPPKPPLAWIPSLQPDGFTYEIQGTEPVCEMPEIPEDHSEPAVIEKSLLDVINVPKGDTKATGNIASGAYLISLGSSSAEVGDPKSVWVKMEKGGPWGVWRWYQRLA